MRIRLRRTRARPWTPRHPTILARPCWRRCCSPRSWQRYETRHDDGTTTITWAPCNNWDRDPITGQLWITCFCGQHAVLPMMLGEYYLAHPEVQA